MSIADTITSVNISKLIADTGATKATHEFHIFKSGDFQKPKTIHKPVRIDHFIIILCVGGTSHVRLNLTDYHIEKNGLLVVPPNTIHEFVSEDSSTWIGLGFIPDFFSLAGLNKKHADAFTFFSAQSDPHFMLSDAEAANLQQVMQMLYDRDRYAIDHPFKTELIHHGFNVFMYELAAIAQQHRGEHNLKITRKEDILLSFLKVLSQYFREERSVQFYASLLFVSPKHLTKTVKEFTNKTCGELIDEMVIVEAKALLNESTHSVANVADYLHFSDQFFFSKFFKKRTGLSPSEYRNAK